MRLCAFGGVVLAMVALSGQAMESPAQSPTPAEIKAVDAFIKTQERLRSTQYVSDNLLEFREGRQYAFDEAGGSGKTILAVRYTLEEGNNWTLFLAAFSRPTMKCQAHARVGGKGYRNVDISGVKGDMIYLKIELYSTYDALCCPSVPGSTIYELTDDSLVEKELRVDCEGWRPPERRR